MKTKPPLLSRFRPLPLSLLGLGALASAQSAAPNFGVRVPTDYLSRLASIDPLLESSIGYGVRGFPLPFTQDVRVSLAKRPNYWEYAVSTRYRDTLFAAGVFDNGSTATAGIPRLEITRDPFKGFQYSGRLQGNGAYSRFTAGYAFTVAGDRVRILNNAGVAFQGDVTAPYTQTEASGNYGKSFGPLNVNFGTTARLFTFPVQGQLQGSVDLSVGANVSPARGLTLEASQLERFAAGSVAIPDLNLVRYRQTDAAITYRLPAPVGPSAFSVGGVRTRVTRDWTYDYTYLRNDLLFRSDALPVLVGPSVGYQWGPSAATTTWLLGVSFLSK
ncbi:hypothetical protein [Deinococcus petrolearius]|uniref:Uncharacterized protein n=1 Tax=Deinococcus petrolearius TaxID=1751295 RepID=A0ABW1DLD6_9DEIO